MGAGSIILGASISTAFWKGWDDPTVVSHLDFAADPVLAQGLNLLEGRSIFPHYAKELHADLVAKKRASLPAPGRLEVIEGHEALVFDTWPEGGKFRAERLKGDPNRGSIF